MRPRAGASLARPPGHSGRFATRVGGGDEGTFTVMMPANGQTTPAWPVPDSMTCSPDGETRGKIARVGDVFPLDPSGHFFAADPTTPTEIRPWGLRYARPATIRAGKHEGGTRETSGTTDGDRPGEEISGV